VGCLAQIPVSLAEEGIFVHGLQLNGNNAHSSKDKIGGYTESVRMGTRDRIRECAIEKAPRFPRRKRAHRTIMHLRVFDLEHRALVYIRDLPTWRERRGRDHGTRRPHMLKSFRRMRGWIGHVLFPAGSRHSVWIIGAWRLVSSNCRTITVNRPRSTTCRMFVVQRGCGRQLFTDHGEMF
jgi:hypothetical protein